MEAGSSLNLPLSFISVGKKIYGLQAKYLLNFLN